MPKDDLEKFLLLAAIPAVFYMRFTGEGKHTLTLMYDKALGFNIPLTPMAAAVWKKIH